MKAERFDFPGAVLFLATFSVLLIALNQGHTYGWTSSYIVWMFAAAILLLAIFVLIESRTRSPLLDLSLFRAPAFSLSATSAICNYMAMFTIAFLMPFYLIQGHGLSSSSAGLLMTVQPVMMVVSAPAAGAISDRIGTRWLATLGMALMAVAMYLLSRLGPTSSLAYIGTAIGTAGLGIGIFVAPNSSAMMGSAPRHRQGIAGGVVATARYHWHDPRSCNLRRSTVRPAHPRPARTNWCRKGRHGEWSGSCRAIVCAASTLAAAGDIASGAGRARKHRAFARGR